MPSIPRWHWEGLFDNINRAGDIQTIGAEKPIHRPKKATRIQSPREVIPATRAMMGGGSKSSHSAILL